MFLPPRLKRLRPQTRAFRLSARDSSTALAVCVLLLLAAPAIAQEPSRDQQMLNKASIFYGAAALTDGLVTLGCVSGGHCGEGNPAFKWAQGTPVLMFSVSKATDAAGIYVIRRFVGRKHPKIATGLFYGAAAARFFFAARGVQIWTTGQTHGLPARFPG